MSVHVALLRAINVAGQNKVAMSDLRGLFEALSLLDVRSLVQSGNLVFEGEDRPAAELEALLERETETRLSLRTDYLVRTAEEWRQIVDANPFPAEAENDPRHLLVVFLKRAPNTVLRLAEMARAG